MKAIGTLVLVLGLCGSVMRADERERHSWNLAKDVLATSNEISFSQGANDVWYFLESASLTHDPFTYSRLSHYTVFCDFDPVAADGSACLGPADRDVVGNRVLWSIDKGATTIRSGDVPNGGGESFPVVLSVRKDQLLYFIVDPKAEYSCDGTQLQLVINRADGD